ncbi:hypothetical protein F6X42_43780 [Paraburkholderia sp. WC7.3b]|uniref:Uncharacterized protein n=2 Tax=Paraburkholderia podalyriae TaxID=1938811 RepID=A0ABR7Q3Q0_9BURK|nr:hypothetical protein [Paraburkholderia podalyriae]
MHDLSEIAHWLESHTIHHVSDVHATLPDPTFISNVGFIQTTGPSSDDPACDSSSWRCVESETD